MAKIEKKRKAETERSSPEQFTRGWVGFLWAFAVFGIVCDLVLGIWDLAAGGGVPVAVAVVHWQGQDRAEAVAVGPGFAVGGPATAIADHPWPAPGHPLVALGDQHGLVALQQPADPAGRRRVDRLRLVLGLVADQHALVVAQDDRVVRHADHV